MWLRISGISGSDSLYKQCIYTVKLISALKGWQNFRRIYFVYKCIFLHSLSWISLFYVLCVSGISIALERNYCQCLENLSEENCVLRKQHLKVSMGYVSSGELLILQEWIMLGDRVSTQRLLHSCATLAASMMQHLESRRRL